MKSFKFEIGNSSTGPIGLVARVIAEDQNAAIKQLREALPTTTIDVSFKSDSTGIEYIHVYLAPGVLDVWNLNDNETEDILA